MCVYVCVYKNPDYITHTHFYPAHKAPDGNEGYQQRCHYKVPGFQLISAADGSTFLFDVAGQPGVVHRACLRLCQIKGQCLDGETAPLFIPL